MSMTDTELMGEALASALYSEPSTFGAEQAKVAYATVSSLVKAGKASDETADRVRAELGNHSAVRQWAIKQGFLPSATASEDARAKAVKAVFARMDAALEATTAPAKPTAQR